MDSGDRRVRIILVADDDLDQRTIYATILGVAGYEAFESSSGEDTLRKTRILGPDLVVLDLTMPDVSGIDAAKRLKADPATREVPSVAVSALAMNKDRDRAMEHGCDGYFAKPITHSALLRWVEAVIGPPPADTRSEAKPVSILHRGR